MISTTSWVYWSSKYHSLGQSSTTQFDFSFRQDLVISWENFDHKKLASLCGQLRDWKVWRSCEEKVWSYLLLHSLMLGHFVFYQEKPDIIMFCWALLVYNETTVIYSRWYLLVLLLLPQLVKETTNDGIMSNNLIPGSVPLLWSHLFLILYLCNSLFWPFS